MLDALINVGIKCVVFRVMKIFTGIYLASANLLQDVCHRLQ